MRHPLAILIPLFASLIAVSAQSSTSCSASSQCPSDTPCCSEFGFCGSGTFCLGGCNPLASHALDSCKPRPVCKDATYNFSNNSRILSNYTDFDGDATKYDWVIDKGTILNTNSSGGELELLLTQSNGGTRLSSTRYVHYGTISAKIKTSHWNGVVTAFITMSDIKDEIDWEWPGNQVTEAQTNYFWQGMIATPTNGDTAKDLSDTSSDYHEYTIDWQSDAMSFLIDGKNVRTIKASDAKNGSLSQYPNTPSRIQMSIWPAGIDSSPPGTVSWAGGMIDWSDPDYQSAGHFSALVSSVSVKCKDSSSSPNMTSYVYGSNSTDSTPNITMSAASTLLSGSDGGAVTGTNFSASIGKKAAVIAGGVIALVIAALVIRQCVRSRSKKAVAAAGTTVGFGAQTYQPLKDPAANASVENHAMPNLGYGGQPSYNQYGRPPYRQ